MSYTEKLFMTQIESVLVQFEIDRDAQRFSVQELTLEAVRRLVSDFDLGVDFVSYCVWYTSRKTVGRYLMKRFKDADGEIRQLRFPGFELLQRAYIIGAGDRSEVVSVDVATAEELDMIADRLESEGQTKMQHAREVRQYRVMRYGQVSVS